MDLLEFLSNVDEITARESKENLEIIFHNIARKVPEALRENFLKLMLSPKEITDENSLVPVELLDSEIESINKIFEFIDFGDLFIEKELNEDYDDWYDDISEEFYYYDRFDLGSTIIQASTLVNQLYDLGEYQKCYDLGRSLLDLDFEVVSEYDAETFSVEDVIDEFSIQISLLDLLFKTARSAYYLYPPEKSAEIIADLFGNVSISSLEKFLQFDKELQEVDQFYRI